MFSFKSLASSTAVEAHKTSLIECKGIGEQTVYNPFPFVENGELKLLARVEPREHEVSKVFEFSYSQGGWIAEEKPKAENIQDPFVFQVGQEMFFGGVEVVESRPLFISNYRISLRKFSTGEEVAYGPWERKGVRLIDEGGKIGVFVRPREEFAQDVYSSINFDRVSSLSEITSEFINALEKNSDKKVEGFFGKNEWGGVNSVYMLEGGWLGVVGHLAHYTDIKDVYGNFTKKYTTIVFEFHPETKEVIPPRIVFSRADLNFTLIPKREDLQDVIYPGGFIFLTDEHVAPRVLFFYGIVDAYVGVAELPYPFTHVVDSSCSSNKPFLLTGEKAKKYFSFL